MIGADRDVKGGVSSVVNQYYAGGLDNLVDLKYIPTMKDGGKIKKTLTMIKAFYTFITVIGKYDILHVHMSKGASFYRKSIFIKIAHRFNKKIIVHMHSGAVDTFYDSLSQKKKKYFTSIFEKVDCVIVLSNKWKKFFEQICKSEKIYILPNSVTVEKFEREDYCNHNFLCLGRLGKNKGTFDMLKIIPKLISDYPDIRFWFAGDGEIEKCKQIAKENNIENYVCFPGWISGKEKKDLLIQCSNYILPSYSEGMPMSVLEAMAYKCLVISTDVGGISEFIQSGENGFLINAGNITEIEKTIRISLESDRKKEIADHGYKTVEERFNTEKNIYKLLSLYEKLQ